MSKILIISDSHGLNNLANFFEIEKPDYAIHAGDSQLSLKELMLFDVCVKGNCDYDKNLLEQDILKTGDLNLFVCHGHLENINYTQEKIIKKAKDKQCKIIIHGHTHVVCATLNDKILILNPGSLRQSRCAFPETYMVLDFSLDKIIVELKNANTYQVIEKYQFFMEELF